MPHSSGGKLARIAFVVACLLAAGRARAEAPEPLFRVFQGGRWGFVDRAGKIVIPPRFEAADRFSDGLASVRVDRQLGYVDATGKLVLVTEHEPAGRLHRRFSQGLAAVKKGARIGFMDRAGKLVIPAVYLTAEDFSEGLALVCSEKGCGFVDPSGAYRGSPMWMGGTSFKNGYASVILAMGMTHRRTSLIGRSGALVPGEFEGNGNFSEDLAPVRVRGRWGYVDAAGNPAVRARFGEAGDFSEGLAAVTLWETGRCGYIDRTGKLVVDARFASCRPFSGGLARVDLSERPEDGEKVAFVDRAGKVAILGATARPPFLDAEDFVDGVAAVGVGGPVSGIEDGTAKLGYIDRTGRYVWPPGS